MSVVEKLLSVFLTMMYTQIKNDIQLHEVTSLIFIFTGEWKHKLAIMETKILLMSVETKVVVHSLILTQISPSPSPPIPDKFFFPKTRQFNRKIWGNG